MASDDFSSRILNVFNSGNFHRNSKLQNQIRIIFRLKEIFHTSAITIGINWNTDNQTKYGFEEEIDIKFRSNNQNPDRAVVN